MKKYLFILFLFIAAAITVQAEESVWAVYSPDNINSDFDLLTIVGPDDRVDITANAKGTEKAIVLLEISDQEGLYAYCSGAMLGYDIVLTAAHCLIEKGKFLNSIKVYAPALNNAVNTTAPAQKNTTANRQISWDNYVKLPEGFFEDVTEEINNQVQKTLNEMPSANATQMFVPTQYITYSQQDLKVKNHYDYGVLILDKPLGIATGWFGLKARSDYRLSNANIVTFGFPDDKPNNTLWKSKGNIGAVWDYTFAFNADILHGNSGGPVVLENKPDEIIGITIGQCTEIGDYSDGGYPNIALRLTDSVMDIINQQKRQGNQYLMPKD